jgi:hypothetical protein
MTERLGLLFADGSLLVLPEEMDADTTRREAEEHDGGGPEPRTRVVRLRMEVVDTLDP